MPLLNLLKNVIASSVQERKAANGETRGAQASEDVPGAFFSSLTCFVVGNPVTVL